MSVQGAKERIDAELKELQENPDVAFEVYEDNENDFVWFFKINDLLDLANEDGVCTGEITFSEEYPTVPPEITIYEINGVVEKTSYEEHKEHWNENSNAAQALNILADFFTDKKQENEEIEENIKVNCEEEDIKDKEPVKEEEEKPEDTVVSFLDMPRPFSDSTLVRKIIPVLDLPIAFCIFFIAYVILLS